MRFADLDAVTVDGFGTLVELEEPVKPLVDALETHGVRRSAVDVADAFAQEAAYYRPRSHFARDAAGLERLRRECVAVFLDALKAPLDPQAVRGRIHGRARLPACRRCRRGARACSVPAS